MCAPPERWSLPLRVTQRRQKGRVCGLLTALIIATSSDMSTGPKPETPSSPARKTSFQHTMAVAAVPPLPNTALEPQMLTFPNIGRAIAGTPDFTTLDLPAGETAVLALHDFNQLVGFKADLLLPDINQLYFIYPDQTHLHSIDKITLEAQSLPSISFYSPKPLRRLCHFQSRRRAPSTGHCRYRRCAIVLDLKTHNVFPALA